MHHEVRRPWPLKELTVGGAGVPVLALLVLAIVRDGYTRIEEYFRTRGIALGPWK